MTTPQTQTPKIFSRTRSGNLSAANRWRHPRWGSIRGCASSNTTPRTETNSEFRGHFDATTEVHPAVATASTTTASTTTRSQISYLTVLLYLNDGGGDCFEGGETEFLSQHHHLHRHDRSGDNGHGSSSSGSGSTMVTPRAGSIVVFEHDLFHRGRPLAWGTKYVLRTDVLFEDRACDPGDGDDDSDDPSLPPRRTPPPPPSEAGVRTVPDSAAATATESTSHSHLHSQEIAPLLFTVEDVLRR
eukprot:jgi/Psemu1/285055/fgenesh1_pg.72_\